VRELGGAEAAARRFAWALARSAEEATRLRTPEGHRLVLGLVTRGARLIPMLEEQGIRRGDIYGVMDALKGQMDFKKIRPGQTFVAHLEEGSGRLLHLRYSASLEEVFEVTREGKDLVGRRLPVEILWREVSHGGTVVTSIGETLAEQGAHYSLSHRVSEVLSRQVKLFKEQRFGDNFRVLLAEARVDGKFLRYGPVLGLEYTAVRGERRRYFLYEAKGEEPIYYDDRGVSLPRSVLHIPVHYTRITSPFGMRMHPVLKRMAHHAGVDMAAPSGTPVRACMDGKVLFAGRRGAYGNLVILDHGGGLHSYYGHLLAFAPGMRPGREVKRSRNIGLVGSTGRSTGPHLHFGLQRYGLFIDPLAYRIQPGAPAPARHRTRVAALLKERGAALDQVPILPPSRLLCPGVDLAPAAQGIE
jgi:murein DD-endopeptidase MepM/ murein hydrolase activator NlpD